MGSVSGGEGPKPPCAMAILVIVIHLLSSALDFHVVGEGHMSLYHH